MKSAFRFGLQQFAEPDDDLAPAQSIDIASLSDDPGALKRLIGSLVADNKAVRFEAGKRRTILRAIEQQLADEKAAHATTKSTLEADVTKHKTDLETANRSNGQLRSKFREQFVDVQVRADLKERGVKNVDDAMKLLDVSKIEFDEEKLTVKDPTALKTALDEFAKEREYLFGAPQQQQQRGTSFGRGASDNPGSGNPGKIDIPKDAGAADAAALILSTL